jgi:hypothetical protein
MLYIHAKLDIFIVDCAIIPVEDNIHNDIDR